jgi:hypothetical protein
MGRANFSHACFIGSYLYGVNLGATEGVTKKQFELALVDEKTVGPDFSERLDRGLGESVCESRETKASNTIAAPVKASVGY